MKDTVFQEILKPISANLIKKCIHFFNSDYDYEKFKTYEHLQTMIYVHLNQINSLRTLEASINNQDLKLPIKVCRSTLSDANRKRNFLILNHEVEKRIYIHLLQDASVLNMKVKSRLFS